MSQGLSQGTAGLDAAAAQSRPVWPMVAVATVIGALLALAGGLWAHYGTTVFFEMVRAGVATCF